MALSEERRIKQREHIRQRRAEWEKQGRCHECGGVLDGHYKRCKACRFKNAAYQENHRRKVRGEV